MEDQIADLKEQADALVAENKKSKTPLRPSTTSSSRWDDYEAKQANLQSKDDFQASLENLGNPIRNSTAAEIAQIDAANEKAKQTAAAQAAQSSSGSASVRRPAPPRAHLQQLVASFHPLPAHVRPRRSALPSSIRGVRGADVRGLAVTSVLRRMTGDGTIVRRSRG